MRRIFRITISLFLGVWSKSGCRVERWDDKKGSVLCKCDHLTSFAVIGESVDGFEENILDKTERYLYLVVFIGSFIAVLALGATLITYICIK